MESLRSLWLIVMLLRKKKEDTYSYFKFPDGFQEAS